MGNPGAEGLEEEEGPPVSTMRTRLIQEGMRIAGEEAGEEDPKVTELRDRVNALRTVPLLVDEKGVTATRQMISETTEPAVLMKIQELLSAKGEEMKTVYLLAEETGDMGWGRGAWSGQLAQWTRLVSSLRDQMQVHAGDPKATEMPWNLNEMYAMAAEMRCPILSKEEEAMEARDAALREDNMTH